MHSLCTLSFGRGTGYAGDAYIADSAVQPYFYSISAVSVPLVRSRSPQPAPARLPRLVARAPGKLLALSERTPSALSLPLLFI